MIPRCKVGTGISGAVRYVLGEGKDPATGKPRTEPKDEHSRVAWIGGTGFGFEIENEADADLGRRIMEFAALNQSSRTKQCVKDCVHLSLGWRPGEEPTREQMEEAGRQALVAMGMGNARALWASHTDEPYAHLHIVASKINPETGRAYDLRGNFLDLSLWAQDYEREFSGGIVCARREEANLLRDAIGLRDAGAVLEMMTQQRATFKGADLERALAKQMGREERAEFAEAVLSQPDAVRLTEAADQRASRYTSRAVLDAEAQVLRAAAGLVRNDRHQLAAASLDGVLARPEFTGISAEQLQALHHATGPQGLALVDGQAGTGKGFAISAVRQAHEAQGREVIGLAPTNAVAEDMRTAGFKHAATLHSELFRLNNGRASWNERTVVVVDEAAMIDTKLMAQLVARSYEAGAKLILVGDDRQLSSIDRGGMFGVLKDQYGAAELTQVRRQHKPDDRRAAELMAEGAFDPALRIFEAKGAIHWTQQQEQAHAALIAQWAKDSASAPDKSRFVFAYTNADVDRLNFDLRGVRKERGELGLQEHVFATKHGRASFAEHDRVQLTGSDKKLGLVNGAAGTVEKIEGGRISLLLDGREGKKVDFDANSFQDFRHGYAGTIYKGQGRTLDQTYLLHSEHWRSAASYVALTRHRESTALFVARDTAADVSTLSRQMARVDDRRAASNFYVHSNLEPVRPLTAAQLSPLPEKVRPGMGGKTGGMVEQQRAANASVRAKFAQRSAEQQQASHRPDTQQLRPDTGRLSPEASRERAEEGAATKENTDKVARQKAADERRPKTDRDAWREAARANVRAERANRGRDDDSGRDR